MHLDEERLQRLIHGELPEADESAARAHVASCDECGSRLAQAEGEERSTEALLARVDEPAPWVSVEAVMRRARMEEAVPRERRVERGRRAGRRELVLIAAAILLGSTAVFAMRASPLREWMSHTLESAGLRAPSHEAPPSAGPRAGGIAVAPGQRLVIAFTAPQREGGARVSCTGAAEVRVQAPPGAASFTSEAERLVVDNRGSSALFEIQLPCDAPWVEIQVAGARVFLKEGERVTPAGVLGSSSLLSLGPAR